jgi:ribose 5-phosphate isomerase RpiB
LALGGWNFNEEKVEKIILTWLKTPFPEVKRHKRRVDKIKRLER